MNGNSIYILSLMMPTELPTAENHLSMVKKSEIEYNMSTRG